MFADNSMIYYDLNYYMDVQAKLYNKTRQTSSSDFADMTANVSKSGCMLIGTRQRMQRLRDAIALNIV